MMYNNKNQILIIVISAQAFRTTGGLEISKENLCQRILVFSLTLVAT